MWHTNKYLYFKGSIRLHITKRCWFEFKEILKRMYIFCILRNPNVRKEIDIFILGFQYMVSITSRYNIWRFDWSKSHLKIYTVWSPIRKLTKSVILSCDYKTMKIKYLWMARNFHNSIFWVLSEKEFGSWSDINHLEYMSMKQK